MYEQVNNPRGSKLRDFQDYLQKAIGLAPVLIKGRGILASLLLGIWARNFYTKPMDVSVLSGSSYKGLLTSLLYRNFSLEQRPLAAQSFEAFPNFHDLQEFLYRDI